MTKSVRVLGALLVLFLGCHCDNETSNETPNALATFTFTTYWNIPTFQCRSHNIFFVDLAKKYNIVQNTRDDFRGNKLAILYDPGAFPAILTSSTQVVYRNGGVPQRGNLSEHLDLFKKSLEELIPDRNFAGVGIIDFESWRPVFRQNFGSLVPYKELSKKIVKESHPFWIDTMVEKEAQRQFERYARIFMEETLLYAKAVRPRGTWGYYAYPYCFNKSPNNMGTHCSNDVKKENERIQWLFGASDNFHPSLYLRENLTSRDRAQLVEGRIEETHRVIENLNEAKHRKILPYFWYLYQDSHQFLSKQDLHNTLQLLGRLGIDGLILWGSSNDVNSKAKCQTLYKYIDNVLGPALVDWQNVHNKIYRT